MHDLAERELTSADNASVLVQEQILALLTALPDWELNCVEGIHRIERVYPFADFASALAFANRVGALAEEEDHHPALLLEWGRVTTSWWSHSLGGVHINDLIMAARTERLFQSGEPR
ncbi:MAG: 4a-hydroxytetrahydrobiopterin dehydratase [Pseudomonadales bacterium]|nr:4a-hydroxytetrahydrobiopterin dehydratase [Pseudomonadales bacterium]|tara:strand:- start:625 stop:975 length:351 start_codon:yes stop_codon:yes gene_type:complete